MSKILTVIRHAKSSWSDPLLEDIKRPLNSRGKRAAPSMGRYLRDAGHIPELLVSSPAKRAYKTAVLMARELEYDHEKILKDSKLYFEGTEAMLQVARQLDDSYGAVFLFSHEPIVSDFCELMCGLSVVKYPTGAACAMSFDVDNWAQIKEGEGQQLFFVKPKAIDPTL